MLRCVRTVHTSDSGGSASASARAVRLSVPAALLDGDLGADAVGPAQKHVLRSGAAGPEPGLLRDGGERVTEAAGIRAESNNGRYYS